MPRVGGFLLLQMLLLLGAREEEQIVPYISWMQGTIGLFFLCRSMVSVCCLVLLPHLHGTLLAIVPLRMVLAGIGF